MPNRAAQRQNRDHRRVRVRGCQTPGGRLRKNNKGRPGWWPSRANSAAPARRTSHRATFVPPQPASVTARAILARKIVTAAAGCKKRRVDALDVNPTIHYHLDAVGNRDQSCARRIVRSPCQFGVGQTQRCTASAVSAGFVLKHSFVEAGACWWMTLISFSN